MEQVKSFPVEDQVEIVDADPLDVLSILCYLLFWLFLCVVLFLFVLGVLNQLLECNDLDVRGSLHHLSFFAVSLEEHLNLVFLLFLWFFLTLPF